MNQTLLSRRQVLLFFSVLFLQSVLGQVSYSIPEEMAKGSLVGNIAQDLGLDVKRLQAGKARIHTGDSAEYIQLNKEKGLLIIKEKIDREALCGQTTPCALHFQIALENPIEIFPITVEITDINDNAPVFDKEERRLEISESAVIGSKFMLEKAVDQDIGLNGLQSYTLKPNDNFILKLHSQSNGGKKVEMILQKPLDREKQEFASLLLTAVDGGEPQRSGTMQIHITVLDANDNAPVFTQTVYKASVKENSVKGTLITKVSASDADKGSNGEVSESASPGARYSLESAKDPDVAHNTIQTYKLNPTDNFKLNVVSRSDGTKYIEMVLHTSLDRENQEEHKLTLTAFDGGDPQKSGSVKINVIVLDANDNAPVFSQSVYRVAVPENALKGTVILTVSATDNDKGGNEEVVYSFSHHTDGASSLFNMDPKTGEITVNGVLDYEKIKHYEIDIEATDKGGLTDTSKILIEVSDLNDNAPVISIISLSNPIPEDSAVNTVIAMLNVKDLDSGKNSQVRCFISPDLPFKIKSSTANFYSLISDDVLDRETVPEYNITITAMDEGSPPYSTNKTINLRIADVNDHAPVFTQNVLTAFITENNSPGMSVLSVKASDRDFGSNARISYFLEDRQLNGMSASAYFSVNAESGEILAVRSFDYEQTKDFHIQVKAQDGGSPPLSSNVTVKMMIQDQNDNPPQVLYPVQTGGSVVAEMVPRSADVGYLVTKVVAVDVDSGQNAWLSYKLQKATDRALFEVGSQNGEIRTIRQVNDKDAVKQRLSVIVEDNGQPSRSATVIVNVAVADSFPEVLSEFSEFPHDKEYNDNLTFYLVLALAVVSFLFITCLVVIISVKIYRWRHERLFYKSSGNLPVIPYYPPLYADVGGTGTLKQGFSYEVYGTTDSRRSDMKCSQPFSQSTLSVDHTATRTMPRHKTESENMLTELHHSAAEEERHREKGRGR
uniref:Protocadherin 2 gamma 28 n=1 Tax=Stegastes partitus TaxID=144197 RepID=A0A3B5AIV9_9TELE